ncbi:MAG: hypothetical protein ACI9WV_000545, partial [Patiriisocius sp.]
FFNNFLIGNKKDDCFRHYQNNFISSNFYNVSPPLSKEKK